MRQFVRFFTSPAVFVNQLQWSRNHGWILLTFLLLAVAESQIASTRALNVQLSWLLSVETGWGRDQALFAVMAARIAALLLGSIVLTELFWLVGSQLGKSNSKRVLQRRMAVVFTFLLASYVLTTVLPSDQQYIAAILFGWGGLLSYVTFREHFGLNRMVALLVGLVAVASIAWSWQSAERYVSVTASKAISEKVSKSHSARSHKVRRHRYR